MRWIVGAGIGVGVLLIGWFVLARKAVAATLPESGLNSSSSWLPVSGSTVVVPGLPVTNAAVVNSINAALTNPIWNSVLAPKAPQVTPIVANPLTVGGAYNPFGFKR